MPRTAHRLDAADLLEDGTYSLRRALDGLANRLRRPEADLLPEHGPSPEQPGCRDRAGYVVVAHRPSVPTGA